MRHRPISRFLAVIVLGLGSASVAHAQVYKWVDEKGTVNYGNKPPANARGAKPPTVVEDRVSVYSPDPALAQATQNARDRSGLPNTGSTMSSQAPAARLSGPAFSGAAPTPAPSSAYDPCANPADPNCFGYPSHDAYPHRYRPPPRLVQPQLQPGVTAGNVNSGSGYIPGLSSQAQPAVPPAQPMMRQRSDGRGGFGHRDDDRRR